MRKYFLSLVALAAGLFATSCQESLVEPQIAGPTTFTVQLPDAMGTKADPTLGSAANVNQLFVAVYADASANDATPIYRTVAEVSEGKATVQLNLIQGQLYDVVFWAQVGDNYVSSEKVNNEYNFDLVNIPMNKNYHNTDAGAAFFYYWDNFQPTGTSQPVTLRRPFAQLNLGTTAGSLTNNAGTFTLQSSVIKVKGIADNFNTVSGFGTVTEANKDIEYTFNAVALPSDEEINVAGVNYKYVSMDYLPIVGDDQALITVDATITLSNNQSINHKFTNVPVRENYRTNIVGNLISSSTDFNVVVDADFAKNENGELYPDNDILVVENAAAAQAALDNAKPGDVIELVAGVNYGTLYLRPVKDSPATKEVDWIGNNYHWETYTLFENITILGAEGATVDAIEIEGGTYYNTEHSQKDKYPVMLSLIELRDVEIDGVTFTGKGGYDPQGHGNAINLSGSNIKVDGLTLKNCVLDNPSNNARLIYKTESTTTEHKYTYDSQTKASQEYTFTPSLKDITITGTTFNGGYMGLELRETNNVTITDNVFNVADRNILLPTNSGCTYSGKVTITGNVSNNAKERFVRMAGAGDAEVVIKDNYIYNYQGADADYIKVTDGTNVTIENNVFGKFVYGLTLIPDGENSKIIVRDEEGFLNLTDLFADWTVLFTDGNGNEYSNYARGAGVDYYYGGRWTVSLEADIDLNNETIFPVILKHPVQTGAPTFDGNNHTIKNAKIVTDATTGNEAGLFDASHNNALKNLKLDNIHVTGSNVGNSTAGVLSGSVNADQGVQNITITNSSVTGGKYTGGVIGYGYTDVINCSLTNVTVNGGYKLGGLIGYICASSGTGDVIGNTLTDCTVNGIGGGIYAGGKTEYIIGKVVGNYNCNGTCSNNMVANMTTEATSLIGKIEAGKNVTIENNVCGVSTPAQLKAAIIEGGKIELMNDITVDEWIMFSEIFSISSGEIITVDKIDVTINGNGHTLTINSIESAGNGDNLFQGASNLNISNLTIKYADGLTTGGLGLVSGVIKNVHFVGGGAYAASAAIFPGNGVIKVEDCIFDTNGAAIYFEDERDNLTVTGCTFNQPAGKNVILLRGDVKFTNNTINSGRTVNIVSGSPLVDGNNFNNVRLKVYGDATATVSNNTINTLEFEKTYYKSTFVDNDLSTDAQAALSSVTKVN